ncbi:MAG: alpha/beta hydrolase family protein [Betaproteobacteria bacterium]|nr:alpha/beta hydrolase family protein [Betaproteobacteria bacterium]
MRRLVAIAIIAASQAIPAQAQERCGELNTLTTRGSTTMSYSFVQATPAATGPLTIVLLIGGGGFLDLDDNGCPRRSNRNVLIRMRSMFNESGINTAVVDTPSDLRTEDGFGSYRIAPDHAQDLGMVIAQVRARTKGPVWIAGHSRGSLSAANAASRLTGEAAPDGVILLSGMYTGDPKARRPWAAHSVFMLDLEAIKIPVLVVGHAADACIRSLPDQMINVLARTKGSRQQIATVTGGAVAVARTPNLGACEVFEPHDFVQQENEVAAGLARFMRGSHY